MLQSVIYQGDLCTVGTLLGFVDVTECNYQGALCTVGILLGLVDVTLLIV